MGRNKQFLCETLVSVGEDPNKAKCLTCDKSLKNHTGNIKRHYEAIHKKSFSTLELDNKPSSSKKRKIMQSAPLGMNKEEYLKCIASTVSMLHMPFRYFDEEIFQKLLQPWTSAFEIKFNSKSIGIHLNNMSDAVREVITLAVSKKYVCVKLDIASRMDRSIMGLNIQYVEDFQIVVYTLGMVELTERHCASYLKEKVLEILQTYKIDISQVYSITTDNGANVVKTSKMLQEYKEHEITDEDTDDQMFDAVSNQISESLCAAHTLQLASWDVIKNIADSINQCRDAIKQIRKKMRELQLTPIPVLDNNTRWSSTFEMVKSLLKAKDTVNSLIKVTVKWDFVNEFVKCFKPLAEATTMLQSKQLVMGDFYREWLLCEAELEDLSPSSEIAQMLLDALKTRKRNLMKNNAFLSALYLDARFCFGGSPYLNDEQKKIAISHLLTIYNKLKTLGQLNGEESQLKNETVPVSVEGRYEKLEKKTATFNLLHNDYSSVQESLQQLQYEEKLPFDANILHFWKAKSFKNCTIAKIAQVALAVPATQVSVERAFSALPIVMTKHRRNLSPQNLENILLLKLNPSLMEKISVE